MKKGITYLSVLILSIIYIVVGNKIAVKNNEFLLNKNNDDTQVYEKAKVIEVNERNEKPFEGGEEGAVEIDIKFQAEISSGEFKGQKITGTQHITPLLKITDDEVKKGDRVILLKQVNVVENTEEPAQEGEEVKVSTTETIDWNFAEYDRIGYLIGLGVIFLLGIIIFGKAKGVNTIIALLLMCLSIFLIYIPAILGGQNIYIWTIITAVFITISTLVIVYRSK